MWTWLKWMQSLFWLITRLRLIGNLINITEILKKNWPKQCLNIFRANQRNIFPVILGFCWDCPGSNFLKASVNHRHVLRIINSFPKALYSIKNLKIKPLRGTNHNFCKSLLLKKKSSSGSVSKKDTVSVTMRYSLISPIVGYFNKNWRTQGRKNLKIDWLDSKIDLTPLVDVFWFTESIVWCIFINFVSIY